MPFLVDVELHGHPFTITFLMGLCGELLNGIKSEGDYFLSFSRANLHGETPLQGLEGAR